MTTNAQFRVDFIVHLPSDTGGGDTFRKSLYLSSPDLRDPRAASKRACSTAKLRLQKWLAKTYPAYVKRPQVAVTNCLCVG